MAGDIEHLLQRTAVGPSQPVDAAVIVGRGRRRRRWRQGLAAACGLALIAVAVVVLVPLSDRSEVLFDPPAPRTDLAGEEWEVMAVGVTIGSGARIAATQEELDEAGAWFDMDGPAPVLPAGQAALLESVAGDCEDASQVLGFERAQWTAPPA